MFPDHPPSTGSPPAEPARPDRRGPFPSSNNALGRLVAQHRPIHILDIREEAAYEERDPLRVATAELAGARTLLAVPLLKENNLIGAFVIYRREDLPARTRPAVTVTTNGLTLGAGDQIGILEYGPEFEAPQPHKY